MEFRHKTALNGILLFVCSTVFISFLAFKRIPDPSVWNALFWIILLFAAIITASKSFSSEQKGRHQLNYQLYPPNVFILSKIIYNFLLLSTIALLTLLLFSIFIGYPVKNELVFYLSLALSVGALSGILSLTSGISAKANGNFTLNAILSFPLSFPLMLVTIRVSKLALDGVDFYACQQYLLLLVFLNAIVITLTYLLFPYLWRD